MPIIFYIFSFFISGKQIIIYSWKTKKKWIKIGSYTYHICNNLDLPPARNCRQPTQRQQNCSWARFWHGQMMRDPIQLSAPLRSVELFSGIQGGHINFQLESISPAWIFSDDSWISYSKACLVGFLFWKQVVKYLLLLYTAALKCAVIQYIYFQFSYPAR